MSASRVKGGDNHFCGEKKTIAEKCKTGYECPSGFDSECKSNEFCFKVDTCQKVSEIVNNFCGQSAREASQCIPANKCPGGYDTECDDGFSCFKGIACQEISQNPTKVIDRQPTLTPSMKPRDITEVVYTFCQEHGRLTPIYILLRKNNKNIKTSLTNAFRSDVSVLHLQGANIQQKHLRVDVVSSDWLETPPEHFECE